MKKILTGLMLCIAVGVVAQKSIAPEAAKAAFAKAYPNATKVKWEKEDGNFEVSFVVNGSEISAIYTAKGVLQEAEQEMKASELPVAVIAYMKDHYKGIKVTSGAKITKADGSVNYEAAVKGKDVIFDATGKFIKETKQEKD